jgi:hypothetical protein
MRSPVEAAARRLVEILGIDTEIPNIEQSLNFSLGCYGCREATDLGPNESVLGFPGARLEPLLAALDSLANKAVGRSRAKAVFENLNKKESPHE